MNTIRVRAERDIMLYTAHVLTTAPKMQERKMRKWTMTDKSAKLEYAGFEIDGIQFDGLENVGLEYDELAMHV